MKQTDPLLQHLERLISPVVNDMGFDIVRLQFVGGQKKTLQIMAEGPQGNIGIDDCALISRAVSAMLDVDDTIAGEYVLEVSSPGLDRPLTKPADFMRFRGRHAKIKLDTPIDTGRKNFSGTIIEASDETVRIEIDEKTDGSGATIYDLPTADIFTAHLVVTEDDIKADLKSAKNESQSREQRTEH